MPLAISIAPDEMTRRLARIGVDCPFTTSMTAPQVPADLADKTIRIFSFPVPPVNAALTLANLRRCAGIDPARQPSFFDHEWYANEPFMNEPCPPGWRFLAMDVLPESINQPWGELWRPPLAVEVVLMLFLHFLGTGEQLLSRKHTWCRDSASLGRRVTVGAFGRNGVFLSAHPPGYSSRGLGTASGGCPPVPPC
ncbi:MAG TPA: hypothetical protein VFY29_18600 [Terriglobia bacterium]|nr:hypothetical protein [Terriglobia bacterium]